MHVKPQSLLSALTGLLAATLVTLSQPLLANPQWREQGFLDVTSFEGVDPQGVKDSTAGIQAAIEEAHDNQLALYFPEGTYLISDTLRGEVDFQRADSRIPCNGPEARRLITIVGSTLEGKRPLLKLKDGAEGFDNPEEAKPMLHLLMPNPKHPTGEQQNCIFASGVRNLDFDLGHGNTGAIGLRFSSAQECFIEDLRIEARDGFAGITGVPGRTMVTRNVEIIGGRHGFHTTDRFGGSLAANFVHIVLRDQQEAAFVGSIARGATITGFHIIKDRAPAIVTESRGLESGHLGLYDGRIEIREGGGVAVEQDDAALVAVRNVYVKGANQLKHGVDVDPEVWSQVIQAVTVPELAEDERIERAVHYVDGAIRKEPVVEVVAGQAPPESLLETHYWAGPPDFRSQKVVSVASFGAVPNDGIDDVEAFESALQNAIEHGNWLFIPKGTFEISRTLDLPAGAKVFGVPARYSSLGPTEDWKPTEPAYMVRTVDDADAEVVLANVAFATPRSDDSWFCAVDWRAGRHSVLSHVRDILGHNGRSEVHPRATYRVSGNGGGRWFAWTEHYNVNPDTFIHPEFRKLLVKDTHEPFTMYGLNPEHGGVPERSISTYFVELDNAQNYRAFGYKCEANGPIILIKDSENVFLGIAFTNGIVNNDPMLTVEDSTGVEMHGLMWPESEAPLLLEQGYEDSEVVSREHFLALYQRGNLDWSAWSAVPEPTTTAEVVSK